MINLSDIHRVAILGAGTLGLRVALRCALDGYTTTAYDITDEALRNAEHIQGKILSRLLKDERITQAQADAARQRLTYTTDPGEVAEGADLMNESVPENVDIKVKTYEQFADLWPEHTILTTNTSYLLPSQFAEASGRPERFAALHFHDVFMADVVDIMPHPGTAQWVSDLLIEFGASISQIPVFIKEETNGYLFNSMLMSFCGAAMQLYFSGKASAEDIDRAWMGNTKMPIGPLGMLDQIGTKTLVNVTRNQQDRRSKFLLPHLEKMLEEGRLGKAHGVGFYDYRK